MPQFTAIPLSRSKQEWDASVQFFPDQHQGRDASPACAAIGLDPWGDGGRRIIDLECRASTLAAEVDQLSRSLASEKFEQASHEETQSRGCVI